MRRWMRLWVAGLMACFALSAGAAEKITQVTVDGKSYSKIQDVHLVNGGRLVILFGIGGITVTPDKVSRGFLDSWGITDDDIAESRRAGQRQSDDNLAHAIAGGFFRELNGVIYDLRKAQPTWTRFTSARVVHVEKDEGAFVDTNPGSAEPNIVFIRNLPRNYVDNDYVTVMAGISGTVTYGSYGGLEHTIRAYDIGRACKRSEIPEAMFHENLASISVSSPTTGPSTMLPFSDRAPGEGRVPEASLPGQARAVGSGFFVTADGHLVTNFHVVKGANRIEARYKERTFQASVVAIDTNYDLAVVRVEGDHFPCLPLSSRASADLGEPVFTIGFPNIDVQGLAPKYTDGKISSISGIQDDKAQYQISVPVQPGNSGGPLCDNNGEVVGVVVSRLNDMAMLRAESALPQNVNYAVKSYYVGQLLQTIPGVESSLVRPYGKPPNVVQSVEDSVAMLWIY